MTRQYVIGGLALLALPCAFAGFVWALGTGDDSQGQRLRPCGTYTFASRTVTARPGFAVTEWTDSTVTLRNARGEACRAKLPVHHVVYPLENK